MPFFSWWSLDNPHCREVSSHLGSKLVIHVQIFTLGCKRQGQTQAFLTGRPQTWVVTSYHQYSLLNTSKVLSKCFRGTWEDLKITLAPSQCGPHYWTDGHVQSAELVSHAVWYHGHPSFEFLEAERPWEKDDSLSRAQTLFLHFVSISCSLYSGCPTGQYDPGSLAAEAGGYRCLNILYCAPSFMMWCTPQQQWGGGKGERCMGPLTSCPTLKVFLLDAMPLGYYFSFLQYSYYVLG